MLPKYLATLAISVLLVTLAVSSLQFTKRSQVLRGTAVDENLQFEFTIDADSTHTYEITPAVAEFLESNISFRPEGSAHIVSAKVVITPKDVSWSENHENITSTGAALSAQLSWDTPPDSANGARGKIYLDFPQVPGLEGKAVSFHSGTYQRDDSGHSIIREVTSYRSTSMLSFGRFVFALSVGLPFGIVLHTIYWLLAMKGEKRSRIAALPPQSTTLPRTFFPDPIAEWIAGVFFFGLGASVACVLAGMAVYDGFLSPFSRSAIEIILGITVSVALAAVYFTAKYLLTVRVESTGIFYARGRGELQWLSAAWGEILVLTQKSRTYRGNTTYWMELELSDNRKKLKIGQSIGDYPALRDLLLSMYRR